MMGYSNDADDPIDRRIDESPTMEKPNPLIKFMLSIRRGNHGPLNKNTKSVYPFEIRLSELSLSFIQTIVEMKIEDAIGDADKDSVDYKFYNVQHVRLITSKKKPIKDSPYLCTYSDSQLRSLCVAIMNRRRNQFVSLDVSVSMSPDNKRRVTIVDTQKLDQLGQESSISPITFENPISVSLEQVTTIHPIPYVTTASTIGNSFSDVDYVPIRTKIQANDFSFNGTMMFNRDDLCRALGIMNYNQFGLHERTD